MLNEFQKKLIADTLSFSFSAIKDGLDNPLDSLEAFQTMLLNINDISAKTKSYFSALDAWDSIEQIHQILMHECPQNITTGSPYLWYLGLNHDGMDKNGIVYFHPLGYGNGIAKEKQGLLGLTAKDDVMLQIKKENNAGNMVALEERADIIERDSDKHFVIKYHVTKEDVTSYIREKIQQEIIELEKKVSADKQKYVLQRATTLNTMTGKLASYIKNKAQLINFLRPMSYKNRVEALNELRDRLPGIITSGDDLCHVMCLVPSADRVSFLNIFTSKLPNLIKTLKHFGNIIHLLQDKEIKAYETVKTLQESLPVIDQLNTNKELHKNMMTCFNAAYRELITTAAQNKSVISFGLFRRKYTDKMMASTILDTVLSGENEIKTLKAHQRILDKGTLNKIVARLPGMASAS